MTCMIAWPAWLVWLIWISLLFLFYFILLQVSKSYFLAFWAWENEAPSIWKENQQNFEKEDILFLEGWHVYYFHEGISYKREENKKGKWISFFGSEKFSFQREIFFIIFVERHKRKKKEGILLQQIWGVLWRRLIYIRERGKGGRILWLSKVERCTRVEEGDCSQGSTRYASCSFLFICFIILVFPFTFHSGFFGCFWEVVLADWSGHWGPLICVVESKFSFKLALLRLCSWFLWFFFINSWNRDLRLNFNVCGILNIILTKLVLTCSNSSKPFWK